MKRADKAARIMQTLDVLYPTVTIPLDHVDPFTLLVAVVLSAQTTDKKVNEVTPALFARGGTAQAMSQLEVSEVQQLIRQIGLAPSKAKALVGLSKMIVQDYGDEVPQDFARLEAMPGVGHKTASVVMAQAFGHPAFPVDTHIHRLATRWGLTDGKNVVKTEADCKKVFPRDRWNDMHLKIIYFGREHCPALYHDLLECPICAWAASRKTLEAEARADRDLRARRKRK